MKRRDFLVRSAVLGAGVGAGFTVDVDRLLARPARRDDFRFDAAQRDLAMRALDAARAAGASYVDVRINRNRNQGISTRERQTTGLSDNETMGIGVRVIAGGSWGFAATARLTNEDVDRTAQQAVAQARANARTQRRPLELAPTETYPDAEWRTPIEIDPFEIAIEDKVDLLLRANEAALGVAGARFVTSSLFFLREDRFFASSEGTVTDQTIHRASVNMNVTAVADDGSDFQSRSATDIAPRSLGWEYVLDADLVGNAPKWAEEAVQKLSAQSVQPGRYDLVLLPSHLWLTVHESIAHPTELDRIFGYEANYAGTSFIYPLEEYLGKFRYGPEFMNIQGERSSPGSLSTIGYDDEGVRPRDYLIVKDGILWDLQTTREQAPWLADWYRQIGEDVRSHGCSYAQSWADIQFQRMPNINLLPHPDRDVQLDELIDGVENGILIDGSGSFSIDQQRYNAQFGGQVFHEIRNGRIAGMLKDVAYQIRTPEFWNSMDLIGGPSTYWTGGSFGDGKGQPAQSNAISHGCPPSRHRQVNVINTGRSA
ncbi:MAG: TldD/PmbA family protein [Longimicrobiales bacterium]